MSPLEFARSVATEKEALVARYFQPESETAVAQLLSESRLSSEQRTSIRKAVDAALTDMCYTILLALDGEASLGGVQRQFRLEDEDGSVLTEGKLEGAAWEVFHASKDN
jgi:hypothetical protein